MSTGCGKSTAGRTILRLHDITDGKVIFKGEDLAKCSKKEMRAKRLQMQMVFQDPYASLNPRMTVGNIIGEALLDHKLMSKAEAREKVLETMEICGFLRIISTVTRMSFPVDKDSVYGLHEA